jgi:hypothetical protein
MLDRRSKRFAGGLHALKNPTGASGAVELVFSAEVDGEIVLERSVPNANAPADFQIDLAGKRSLALIVEGYRSTANCEWVCIEAPRFE